MSKSDSPNLKKLTEDYIRLFGSKDLRGVEGLLLEGFVLEDPIVKRIEGKKRALEAIQAIFESCKTLTFSAKNLYQDGATTVIEFSLKLDETLLQGVDIIEWEGSKMTALRAYLDVPK